MSQRQHFVINSPGPRGAGIAVVLTLAAIVAWYFRRAVDYVAIAALLLWLMLLLGRRHMRAREDNEQRLKLDLLRARLTAADMTAALKDSDMAQAARDRAAGKISEEDYETALRVAGEEARQRRDDKARSRFRFH